ncbi:hypothetical protein [Saccharothrix texasensis]|uniref:Uncharacterized protein n=1 Tax=Saccharothrix texasensis TaxID=103734 RepID=A0A3N1GXU4_9PSEU|nr:hypothetical protein [Saccharothrix texasensis]ROP34842.1 hypothetical protein EDD40_0046 [Saccharothrix texasensis]
MGEGLFRFVFNTLRPRMAEEGTRFYLPTVLTDLTDSSGGKALPLHADQWQVGTVGGESGQAISTNLVSEFQLAFGIMVDTKPDDFHPPIDDDDLFTPIATPDKALPNLSASAVTVTGLENARLEPDLVVDRDGDGYTSRIVIAFGAFTDLPRAVTAQGRFQLDQWISIADGDGTSKHVTKAQYRAPFDWPTFDLAGTGKFTLSITDLWADVDWAVTVDEGQPVITVNQLTVRGAQPGSPPTLALDDIAFDNAPYISGKVWDDAAEEAFNSDDGKRELVARLQDSLNQPDNLDSLARGLTDHLRSVLDQSIGTADDSTSVDDNLFQRFRQAVNNPDSDYYLPAGVFSVTSPTLDPYQPDTISFQVTLLDTPTTIDLTDNSLVGAANALAPADQLAFDPGVRATVELSTLANGTTVEVTGHDGHKETKTLGAPLTLSGTVSVKIGDDDPFSGPYTVTIADATVDVTLPTSGGADNALDTLTITCTALTVEADLDHIKITAQVGDSFQDIINKELNKPDNKRQVLDRINQELAEPGTLADLGATITTNVRAVLTARLDG